MTAPPESPAWDDRAAAIGRRTLPPGHRPLRPGGEHIAGPQTLVADRVTDGTLAATARLVTPSGARVAGLAARVGPAGPGWAQHLSDYRLLTVCEVPA